MKATAWVLVWQLAGNAAVSEERANETADLVGTVRADDGSPVQGATLTVWTASPRKGLAMLCPSCYPDCGRSTVTAVDGSFHLSALDTGLSFRVLIVAEPYQPAFAEKVIPSAGPLEVRLRARRGDEDPKTILRGRILGPSGQPVVNATVEPYSMRLGKVTHYGSPPGVDPLAVTNGKGEFLLTSENPEGLLRFQVKARGLATNMFGPLRPGGEMHILKLVQGAAIRGHVLRGRDPLEKVTVRLQQADGAIGAYVTAPEEAVTDRDGTFIFLNVTPGLDYVAFGTMETLGGRGSLGPRKVLAGADGTETDLGDIQVGPAFRLAGQLKLADGRQVPSGIAIRLQREDTRDSLHRALKDGRFEIDGLAGGVYRLRVRLSGYRLSPLNRSYDSFHAGGELRGVVRGDAIDLQVLLEHGPEPAPVDTERLSDGEREKFFADHEEKGKLPLRGLVE